MMGPSPACRSPDRRDGTAHANGVPTDECGSTHGEQPRERNEKPRSFLPVSVAPCSRGASAHTLPPHRGERSQTVARSNAPAGNREDRGARSLRRRASASRSANRCGPRCAVTIDGSNQMSTPAAVTRVAASVSSSIRTVSSKGPMRLSNARSNDNPCAAGSFAASRPAGRPRSRWQYMSKWSPQAAGP